MKILVFVFLSVTGSLCAAEPDIDKVRDMCEKAPKDESTCEELLELLEPYDTTANPLLYGYKGIATMIKAKHVFNPFKRVSYFKKGKAMLEEAIAADPSNIELRYLRFSAQTRAPGFLGYHDNLEEDKLFLIKSLPGVPQNGLREKVKSFLLNSDSTTEQEKQRILKYK